MKLNSAVGYVDYILGIFGILIIAANFRGEISNRDSMAGWVSLTSGIGFMLIDDKYPHI